VTADCRWTRPRLIAYTDGELDEPDAELVREHLEACPGCRSAAANEQSFTARVHATGSTERAPAALAGRIRAGLAVLDAQARAQPEPAPQPAPAASTTSRRAVPRMVVGWGLAAAAAAALLLVVLGGLFWPGSGPSLVSAMADEHYEHAGSDGQKSLEFVSADPLAVEKYVSGKLGMTIAIPGGTMPRSKGACCCKRGSQDLALVACFCEQRRKAITLFAVRSEGLSLRGLEKVASGGRDFWRGSAGECRAVLWTKGEVCYALVGEVEPADLLGLSARAAAAIDERDARRP
jgi:anti-sigma factor (TIGR02949 family)